MAARRFAWVLKPPAERPKTSPYIAPLLEEKAPVAIDTGSMQATVLAGYEPPKPKLSDPDEALRMAIKTAVDAGDFGRVKALVAVLESSPKAATVLTIASRRPPG